MTGKIATTVVLFSLVLVSLAATLIASATTVTIQNAEGLQTQDSATLSIMINDAPDVKGAHILLEYDSSIIHVVDIGNSDFGMESYKEINNDTGYVRYAVFNLAPLSGDIKFADVTVKRISPGSSPLNLTVVALNTGSAEIPREVTGGTFTETGEVTPQPSVVQTIPGTPAPTQVQATTPSTPPTATQAPTTPASEEQEATVTPEEPGFEGVQVITGLLAIGYLLLGKKKRRRCSW
jgi:hypothetical protein